jgi:hypothetical protein
MAFRLAARLLLHLLRTRTPGSVPMTCEGDPKWRRKLVVQSSTRAELNVYNVVVLDQV